MPTIPSYGGTLARFIHRSRADWPLFILTFRLFFFLSFFAFLHAAFSSPPYLFAYFETTFALHYNAAAPNTDGAVIDPFGIYRFLTDFEQKTLENIVSLNRNKSFIAKFVS